MLDCAPTLLPLAHLHSTPKAYWLCDHVQCELESSFHFVAKLWTFLPAFLFLFFFCLKVVSSVAMGAEQAAAEAEVVPTTPKVAAEHVAQDAAPAAPKPATVHEAPAVPAAEASTTQAEGTLAAATSDATSAVEVETKAAVREEASPGTVATETAPATEETPVAATTKAAPATVAATEAGRAAVPETKEETKEEAKEANPTEVEAGTIIHEMATQKIEKEKLEARAKAWEEDAISRAESRAQREEAKIAAEELTMKNKAEARLRKNEEALEKQKAKYMEVMKNEVAAAHKAAEEKRAMIAAKKSEDVLKAQQIAAKIKTTGIFPKKFGCFAA